MELQTVAPTPPGPRCHSQSLGKLGKQAAVQSLGSKGKRLQRKVGASRRRSEARALGKGPSRHAGPAYPRSAGWMVGAECSALVAATHGRAKVLVFISLGRNEPLKTLSLGSQAQGLTNLSKHSSQLFLVPRTKSPGNAGSRPAQAPLTDLNHLSTHPLLSSPSHKTCQSDSFSEQGRCIH